MHINVSVTTSLRIENKVFMDHFIGSGRRNEWLVKTKWRGIKTQMGASLHYLPFRFLATVAPSSRQITVYYAGIIPEGSIPYLLCNRSC